MPPAIPDEMTAIRASAAHETEEQAIEQLAIERIATPRPRSGQVLVRMRAAPCNPADFLYVTDRYGIDRPFPATLGFEGAGEVVATGGGMLARWLVGKRVACGGHEGTGTWAEYCVVDATACVVLRRGLSFEEGATSVANPITALALVRLARARGHRAIVQTAAASQLCRLIERIAKEAGVPVLNIVRRTEQAAALRADGADALASDEPGFAEALAKRAGELSATIAFDAVGGPITGVLVGALPRGSEVVVYGALAGEACSAIDPMELAFGKKSVSGFEIASYLKEVGLLRSFLLALGAQKLVASGSKSLVRERVSLEDAKPALVRYTREMSKGKVLFVPGGPG